jgi:hypothetical protein
VLNFTCYFYAMIHSQENTGKAKQNILKKKIDPSGFPTKILYAFLICLCVLHATLITRFLHFIPTGEDRKLLNRELYVIFASLLYNGLKYRFPGIKRSRRTLTALPLSTAVVKKSLGLCLI